MTRPIQPPMTDERLDDLVRQLLTERAEDIAADVLPPDAMAEQIATRLRPSSLGRTWVLLAAAAMLAASLIGGALIIASQPRLPSLPSPPSPPASAAEDEVVHGWPDTTENAAGLYSWGSQRGRSFMHNGYGSGNVAISITPDPLQPFSNDGATAVTVAGHDGFYRRIDAQSEEWIVEIEEMTIAIRLDAEPDARQADLDEAHAIIDSMRTEARDNRPGFRLVFRIATDNWDSG